MTQNDVARAPTPSAVANKPLNLMGILGITEHENEQKYDIRISDMATEAIKSDFQKATTLVNSGANIEEEK